MKYCEIIAANLKESRLELGLGLSGGFSGMHNLDC